MLSQLVKTQQTPAIFPVQRAVKSRQLPVPFVKMKSERNGIPSQKELARLDAQNQSIRQNAGRLRATLTLTSIQECKLIARKIAAGLVALKRK